MQTLCELTDEPLVSGELPAAVKYLEMTRTLIAWASTLGRNAVPAAALVGRDAVPANAFLLYFGENVVLALAAILAVRLFAPKEGVVEGRPKGRREAIQEFLLGAVPFSFGAAVIGGFVIWIRPEYVVDGRELLISFGAMLLFQFAGFGADFAGRRTMTLQEGAELLLSVLLRVFLLAFAVLFGLWLAFFVAKGFLIPFAILKTIVDLWRIRPEALRRRRLASV